VKMTSEIALFEVLARGLSERLQHVLNPSVSGAREIKEQLAYLHRLMEEGRHAEVQWQAIRLASLMKDWDVVAAGMPEFTTELRVRIIRDEVRGSYIGARAELAMAATLLEKGLRPSRGPNPGPDFLVVLPEGTAVLECTSAYLETPKETNFYKIEQAICVKGKRDDYCGSDAVLYVDCTALAWRGGEAIDDTLEARTRAVVENTNWGAVLLGIFMVMSEDSRYGHALARFDGKTQTASLKGLLDKIAPGGGYRPMGSIPPTP
jgi:hypothetical protein